MEKIEHSPLFTNTFSPNEKTDRQVYLKLRFIPRLITFLLGAVMVGFSIYWLVLLITSAREAEQAIYTEWAFWVFLGSIVIWGYLIVREIIAPRAFAKHESKRIKETYRTERIEIQAAFYEDTIIFHNMASNAETQLNYSAIGVLSETKDLVIIRSRQKQLIVFSKLGFNGIDIQEFRAFMNEKCPGAKHRWKKGLYSTLSMSLPKALVVAFKEKCQREGVSQDKVIKEAIEHFLSNKHL